MQDQGSSSGITNMGYNVSVDRARNANPAWMENMRLNPEESCLAQRYSSAPYAGMGPAMMGSFQAAEKIPPISDEDGRLNSLHEFMSDIWIRRDNYGWNEEQVIY